MEPPPRLDGGSPSGAGSGPAGGAAAGRPPSCLLLFTKPAVPGRVKTRLIGALTATQAAELHAAFLADLLARLRHATTFDLRLAWAVDEGEPLPPSPFPAVRQEGAGLGERLYRALAAAAHDYPLVAAVGSD